jgi:hypothetical protein
LPGNIEARNTYRQPGRWNADAMLAKRFRFGDRLSLQLRLEAYSLLNHATLHVVECSADTANPERTAFRGSVPDLAGSVAGDGQRRIHVGARLEF